MHEFMMWMGLSVVAITTIGCGSTGSASADTTTGSTSAAGVSSSAANTTGTTRGSASGTHGTTGTSTTGTGSTTGVLDTDPCVVFTDRQSCSEYYSVEGFPEVSPVSGCAWVVTYQGSSCEDATSNRAERCVLFSGQASLGCVTNICDGNGPEVPSTLVVREVAGGQFEYMATSVTNACDQVPYFEDGWETCDGQCDCICEEWNAGTGTGGAATSTGGD